MKSNFFVVVGLVIAAGMLLVVGVVPSIQTTRIRDNQEVTAHLEKARRLLEQYNPHLSMDAGSRAVLAQVDPAAASPALEGVDLDALMQDPAFNLQDTADAELQAYAKLKAVSMLPQVEQESLELQYGAEGAQQHARPRPPSSLRTSMVRDGSKGYEQELSAHERLLDQADAEVKEALAVDPQHASANRLSGMISYHRGLASSAKLNMLREELAAQRLNLRTDLRLLKAVSQDRDIVTVSDIDALIGGAEAQEQQALAAVGETENVVAELQNRINLLKQRLELAIVRGEAARETMEALQDVGVDLSHANGFSEFKATFERQSNEYRTAMLEAHVLQYGTLNNAAIDYTGDYIHGKYEPVNKQEGIKFDRGITHYEQDHASAAAELQKRRDAHTRFQATAQSLREVKTNLEGRAQISTQSSEQHRAALPPAYEQFKTLESQVRTEAQGAVQHFTRAASAFKNGRNGVGTEESEATQSQPDNPQRKEYHYSKVAADQGWLKGQLFAQEADCELRIGFIEFGRYEDAQANLQSLATLQEVVDVSEQVETWSAASAAAEEGVLERSNGAINLLEKEAKNKIREGNWIVAAEIGTAYYLQALLDVDLAADKALEWYKTALENREDKLYAAEFVAMRNHIRGQSTPITP